MDKLLINTKSIKSAISIDDFFNQNENSLKLLQSFKLKKFKIFADLYFYNSNCNSFCDSNLEDFKSKLFSDKSLNRDQKRLILSSLNTVQENEKFFDNILDDELLINEEAIDCFSTESLCFYNKIHQLVFSSEVGKRSIIVRNQNNTIFEIFLIHDQWHYNVFSLIDSLDVENDIALIFNDTNLGIVAPQANLGDFSKFEKKCKLEILKEILIDWPIIVLTKSQIVKRKIKVIKIYDSLPSLNEYRLTVLGNNEYRLYYGIKNNQLYILADYFKKTQIIPDHVKDKIKRAYDSI